MPTKMQAAPKRPADSINIKELLYYFLSKWYWFVISVAVCVAFASYKLMSTRPTYVRTITVMFKTEESGNGTLAMPDLSALGISNNSGDLANEMIVIRSVDLLTDVVATLDLNNMYYVDNGLHNKLLYNNSPVTAVNMAPEDKKLKGYYSFTITMVSATRFTLSDFAGGTGDTKNLILSGEVGRTYKTPVGPFRINTTEYFTKEYINEPVTFIHNTPEALAASFSGNITFELKEFSTSIINLIMTDESPQRAEDVLNTLLDVYNQRYVIERNQAAQAASQFITDRLNVIENELGDVESNISNYRSSNLIGDGSSTANGAMQQRQQSQNAILELNNRLSLVKYLRREVQNASLDQPLPNPAGIEGTTVESQIAEYNTIVRERNRMLATSSDNNPLVQDRTNTLNTLRKTMVQSIDNYLLTLNTTLRTLEQQEAKSTSELIRSPSQAKYLLSVERQQKVKEQLYLFLLQKREENELSQAYTAFNTRIINRANGPGAPIAPRGKSTILMAIAIGIAFPLIIIFIIKNLDSKVRNRRDLAHLPIPYLGEIPFYGKKPTLKSRILLSRNPESDIRSIVVRPKNSNAINEAFRVVRSNFHFISQTQGLTAHKDDIRVMMVTSFFSGSGKTFIALNFATSLAVQNHRTVLIDLDMRKGVMSKTVGPGHKGISNYIIGQSDINEIIVHNVDDIEGLDMIPVGAIPPNPSEMLYSSQFEQLISQLKTKYDYIIIDCPPIDIVADAQIIGRLTDMTVFVVRAGMFDKADLHQIQELYDTNRYRNIALILNGVDIKDSYYSNRYYGYGNKYADYIKE